MPMRFSWRRNRRLTPELLAQCWASVCDGREPPLAKSDRLRHALVALESLDARAREAAFDLLLAVAKQRPGLLRDEVVGSAETAGAALVHLAAEHARFRAAPSSVRVSSGSPRDQVAHLAHQLLFRFELPRFAVAAFCDPVRNRGVVPRLVGLGDGASVRDVFAPAEVSRRAAHLFRAAPHDLSVVGALRYAQMRALGGSDALARVVGQVAAVGQLADRDLEAFVTKAFGWLRARYQDHALVDVGCVLRYVLARADFDPRFSLRRRSWERVYEDAVEFAAEDNHRRFASSSGLKGARFDAGDGAVWELVELKGSMELFLEGERMSHCVYGYVDEAHSGYSAIFSLRRARGVVVRRALTLEVVLGRRAIVQAYGRGNRAPKDEERAVLERWAKDNELDLELEA